MIRIYVSFVYYVLFLYMRYIGKAKGIAPNNYTEKTDVSKH